MKAHVVFAVAGLALLAGCSSSPNSSYGWMSPQANEEAILRQQVANQDPVANNRGMYLSLIQEMQNKGSYFASLAHIDAFELKYGSSPDVELLRGHALREAGQSAESAAVYKKLLSTSEGAAAAQGLGLLAGARGDYTAAVAALRDAARRDPTNALIVSDLGYALLRQGDTAGARLPIAQAAELAPDNPKILGNLALLLLVSGDPVRADSVMKKAGLSAETQVAVRRMADDIHQPGRPARAGDAAAMANISAPAHTPAVMNRPVVANTSAPAAAAATNTDMKANTHTNPPMAPLTPERFEPSSMSSTAPMQRMLDRFNASPP